MSTEPVATVFSPTTRSFLGLGVNATVQHTRSALNMLQDLSLSWGRITLNVEDLGKDAILFDTTAMDAFWENSHDLRYGDTRYIYSALSHKDAVCIYTIKKAPKTWLTKDSRKELCGDALLAFSRLWVSAIFTYKRFGLEIKYIEPVDEPDTLHGMYVSPQNYVILVRSLRCLLSQRGLSNVKIMGPGVSRVIGRTQQVEPYISAFTGTEGLLDYWSIHAVENNVDVDFWNSGTFAARRYMGTNLLRNIQFMNWILPTIPVMVTKYTSLGTNIEGLDYGSNVTALAPYGLRLMDNLAGIMSAGATVALTTFLSFPHDPLALFTDQGAKKPFVNALALADRYLPLGFSYQPSDLLGESMDKTVKAVVVHQNCFGAILSRSQWTDGLLGTLVIRIENPEWDDETAMTTLSAEAYPSIIDLSGMQKSLILGTGYALLVLKRVPYQCVIFIKGDIYSNICNLEPPIQQTTINVPQISDLQGIPNPQEGDVVWHIQSSSLKVYSGGAWHSAQASSTTVQ